MWLEITPEDIARAEAESETAWISTICPTAQALKRLYPGEEVSVGSYLATVGDKTFVFHDGLVEQVNEWTCLCRFKAGQYEIEEEVETAP